MGKARKIGIIFGALVVIGAGLAAAGMVLSPADSETTTVAEPQIGMDILEMSPEMEADSEIAAAPEPQTGMDILEMSPEMEADSEITTVAELKIWDEGDRIIQETQSMLESSNMPDDTKAMYLEQLGDCDWHDNAEVFVACVEAVAESVKDSINMGG